MRTRILPKMLNSEVEEYLQKNDIIFVPVGTVELHGGYPLDSETVISEAFALELAEACDGLVLTGLPYFYAGATASGRGTVQVSVREGIDYLMAIAKSLLRQGFKRQIYLSFHGPAMLTCAPVVRDFQDETGVPILYIDLSTQVLSNMKEIMLSAMKEGSHDAMQEFMAAFHSLTIGSYDKMGRLDDIPLVTGYQHNLPQTCTEFNDIFNMSQQSGSIGYYFADVRDHMSTIDIPDEETREKMAKKGREMISLTVEKMNPLHIVEQMCKLDAYNKKVEAERPWVPSAYNQKH